MKTIRFGFQKGLTDIDLKQIHDEVLQVLEKTGVECKHPKTLTCLSGGNGITVQNERIKFSGNLVNEYIEKARSRSKGEDKVPDEIKVSGPWNCFNIEDMDTGKVRASTAKDVQEMFKLISVTKAGPVSPVYPTDIEHKLQLLYLEKTGIELTDTTGSNLEFGDKNMLEFVIEMYKSAGRKYGMDIQFPISPLRFNPMGLEMIWEYMGRNDVELLPSACPIPQAGLTAPLFLPGALVQSAAEAFASHIVIDKISGGKLQWGPFFRIDLFDMRYMTTVFSSPEHILYQLLLNEICIYFSGQHMKWHYFSCNAKKCDLQSVLERTGWIVTLAFAGFRHFYLGAGQLSMDEIFSPAQFIIDQEIVKYATHLIRGVEYEDKPGVSFDVINEVVNSGQNFITHETTLDNFRKFFESELFPRTNVNQWRSAGEPDIREKAVEKAKALINSYQYNLDANLQKELDRIYEKAKKYIISKS